MALDAAEEAGAAQLSLLFVEPGRMHRGVGPGAVGRDSRQAPPHPRDIAQSAPSNRADRGAFIDGCAPRDFGVLNRVLYPSA
jgi:hypothetical protein